MDLYCPAEGPQNTEGMWLIYGVVAMTSPIALVLAGRWVKKGMQEKAA
jgi:POT family proton-dependent oligopeptide transporter